jgi:hypothetical protein
MRNWFVAFAFAGFCAACGGSGSPENSATPASGEEGKTAAAAPAAAEKPAEPVYKDVILPAGTTLRLELKSSVASDTSKIEDPVRAVLRQPITIDGREVLPVGAEFSGSVTEVERSGRVKGLARIGYRFNSVRSGGERYDVRTASITHQAEPTKKKDATKVAIGAGAGAALGAILGGGSGAAKGAAIGGGAGTGAVLATRGDEVRRGPGADVTTRLTAPLTVRIKA